MLATWIGLFVLGSLTAYQHLYSLKSLVLKYITVQEKPDLNIRSFGLYWWVRQCAFILVVGLTVMILKRFAIPYLLGVISFEILGKKLVLRRYGNEERKV